MICYHHRVSYLCVTISSILAMNGYLNCEFPSEWKWGKSISLKIAAIVLGFEQSRKRSRHLFQYKENISSKNYLSQPTHLRQIKGSNVCSDVSYQDVPKNIKRCTEEPREFNGSLFGPGDFRGFKRMDLDGNNLFEREQIWIMGRLWCYG